MQELYIVKKEENNFIALIENGKIQEYYEENENEKHLEGNIYIAKVKDVLPGMQAAFVDIGEDKNTFIHIKDILPKTSNVTGNKNEILENYDIRDYIKKGDNILVQVKKDATNNKGARITKFIHIVGRFAILVLGNSFITISQKIDDETEKNRLITIAEKTMKELNVKNMGLIIRTAAEGKEKDNIESDIRNLVQRWKNIEKTIENTPSNEVPKVLQKNDTIIQKILLDLAVGDLQKIAVNDKKIYNIVKKYLDEVIGKNNINIELVENEDLFERYDLNEQIQKLQNRKIWLKCGGFITIDKTEALTAIDVNSGKYTGKGNLEQTVLKVNKEASEEIARQLRLRDIGGIIIIDYIDMNEENSRNLVIKELQDNLKVDRAKTQIMGFTKLDLLEMTRKHMFN